MTVRSPSGAERNLPRRARRYLLQMAQKTQRGCAATKRQVPTRQLDTAAPKKNLCKQRRNSSLVVQRKAFPLYY